MRFFAAFRQREMAAPPHVGSALFRPPRLYRSARQPRIEKAYAKMRQSRQNCCLLLPRCHRCANLMEGDPYHCQWSETDGACLEKERPWGWDDTQINGPPSSRSLAPKELAYKPLYRGRVARQAERPAQNKKDAVLRPGPFFSRLQSKRSKEINERDQGKLFEPLRGGRGGFTISPASMDDASAHQGAVECASRGKPTRAGSD